MLLGIAEKHSETLEVRSGGDVETGAQRERAEEGNEGEVRETVRGEAESVGSPGQRGGGGERGRRVVKDV